MELAGRYISELLNCYLWDEGRTLDKSKFDALPTAEWEKIHSLSLRQGVSAMVLDATVALGITLPRTVKMRFILSTDKIEEKYQSKINAISKVLDIYSQNGINMMILKGVGLAQLYPVPHHRPCSDVDIWLFGKQLEADDILRTKHNIAIDKAHHHHTVFYINGVMFENHYDFIEQHSRRSKRLIEQYLKELSDKELPLLNEIEGMQLYTPAPDLNALFLLMHAGAHFAAETVSIRHLTDWAFFLKNYGDKVDWQRFYSLGKEFGFTPFLECINTMCVEYLGMPARYAPSLMKDEQVVARAIDDVLSYRKVDIPANFIKGWIFRLRRRFANSWKQKMVYNDGQFSAFLLSFLTHIIHPDHWREKK